MSLKFNGHIFDTGSLCQCCVVGDKKALGDPTGTAPLQRRMKGTLALRWQKLRIHARDIIVQHDLLGLNNSGLMQVTVPAIIQGGTKIQAFQRWFDLGLQTDVLGNDGSVMRQFIADAYNDGVSYAAKIIGRRVMSGEAQHRMDALFQLAVVELQGIIEAVSQQSVRAVGIGLLNNSKPMAIVRTIWDRIDKIGQARTSALVGMIIVKAFNDATLDCFQAAGVKKVGLVAEAKPIKVDAKMIPDARRSGPGSRVSRSQTPSGSTIARIRRAERRLAALGRVNVRTAGDDDVCPICQDIADAGPYDIDEARSLIPAHPNCRCAFVPADDARFASDRMGAVHVPEVMGSQ